jgi:Domain of unknown function DUF1828
MTECQDIVRDYVTTIGEGFDCSQLPDGSLLLTTPFFFADGDGVEVVVREDQDRVIVSDFGTTSSRLRLAGVNTRSARVQALIRDTVLGFDVARDGEELFAEGAPDEIADLLERVTSAMRDADALRALRADRRPPSFQTRVVTYLQSQFEFVEEQPTLRGQSGTEYRITAAAGTPNEPVYVHALTGGGSPTGRRNTDHAFRIFADVNGNITLKRKLIMLEDETATPWRPEDLLLLSNVAFVGAWSSRHLAASFISGRMEPEGHLLIEAGLQTQLLGESKSEEPLPPEG